MRSHVFWSRLRFPAIGVILTAVLAGRIARADDLTVLRPDEAPRTMLYRALGATGASDRLDTRRKEVAGLRRRAGGRAASGEEPHPAACSSPQARATFPGENTPQRARRRFGPAQGYRIERVIYESRPRHHVTANCYLPDGPGPFPGVLVPCVTA